MVWLARGPASSAPICILKVTKRFTIEVKLGLGMRLPKLPFISVYKVGSIICQILSNLV